MWPLGIPPPKLQLKMLINNPTNRDCTLGSYSKQNCVSRRPTCQLLPVSMWRCTLLQPFATSRINLLSLASRQGFIHYQWVTQTQSAIIAVEAFGFLHPVVTRPFSLANFPLKLDAFWEGRGCPGLLDEIGSNVFCGDSDGFHSYSVYRRFVSY